MHCASTLARVDCYVLAGSAATGFFGGEEEGALSRVPSEPVFSQATAVKGGLAILAALQGERSGRSERPGSRRSIDDKRKRRFLLQGLRG